MAIGRLETEADLDRHVKKMFHNGVGMTTPQGVRGLDDMLASKVDSSDGSLVLGSGLVAATSNLTLLGGYQDVPGATVAFTPDVDCHALILAVFGLQVTNDVDNAAGAEGTLTVDGTPQADVASAEIGSANASAIAIHGSYSQVYRVPLTAAPHTLKLQARRSSSGASGVCFAAYTNFLYLLIRQL